MSPESGERRSWVGPTVAGAIVVAVLVVLNVALPNIDLQKAVHDISEKLGAATYALVGLAAFLETGAFVGLVLPGETVVMLGGAVAGQGQTSIVLTIGVVWAAAFAGDSFSFMLGRRLGRGFILEHGPKVRITHERFARVESYFDRYGGRTIVIGRFIGLVRALAPFTAGSSGMRYPYYLPFCVLGTGLWSAAFSLVGYFASRSLNRASELAGKGTLFFGLAVGVIVAVVVGVRFLREPENRERLAKAMEGIAAGRALLRLGRRVAPAGRFVADRLSPGHPLGLEFTSLLAVLAVALYVLIAYTVAISADPGPTTGDRTAFDITSHLQAGWLVDVAKVFSALGSAAVNIPLALVAAGLLAVRRRWSEAAVLVVAMLILYVGVQELKEATARARPAHPLAGFSGYAFPSGHAAHSVIFPWLALTLMLRLRPGMAGGSALLVAGFALAALVGLSRVYLRVHYLSDVNAGWALGIAAFAGCAVVALLVTHLRQNAPRDGPRSRSD